MRLISDEYDGTSSSSSSSSSSAYKQIKIPNKLSNLHDKFYYDDASMLPTSNSFMPTNNHVLTSRTVDINNNDLQTSHLWNKEHDLDQYKPSLIQQSTSKLTKLPDSSSSFHSHTEYAYIPQKKHNQTVLSYHNERQLKRKKQSLKSKLQQQQQRNQQLAHEVKVGGNVSNAKNGESQIKGRWWLDTIAKLLHSHPLTLSGNSRSLHNPIIEIYDENNNQASSITKNTNTMRLPWNNMPGLTYQNERHIVPYLSHEVHSGFGSSRSDNSNQNNPSVYGWRRQSLDPISHSTAWIEHHVRQRIQRYKQWLSPKQWKQFLTDDSTTITGNSIINAPDKFNLALFEAAVVGVRRAVAECRYQFRHERWNCSQVPNDETALFGNILLKGIPQTAFIYSIINAGIVQSVAEACLNQIDNCPCNNRGRQQPFSDWQWQGCDHNIHYGRRFSRRLLDTMERGSHIRFEMNLHNNGVGRKLVFKNMERYCRCHGTSGSCTLRTCYRRTPRMRTLGNLLKHIYEHDLVQVKLNTNQLRSIRNANEERQSTFSSLSNNFQPSYLDKSIKFIPYHRNSKEQLTPIMSSLSHVNYNRKINENTKKTKQSNLIIIQPINIRSSSISSSLMIKSTNLMNNSIHPHSSQLVYYEQVNENMFCDSHPFYHILGTKGRLCNSSSIGMNNCRHLCCGRGYITHHYYTMESCNCKFIWCCRVECQQCLVLKKVETCI
ncbi:Protein wingless [Schistosoma japonicum]|nr:Protein wingless [Schistosoma japonicum]